MILLMFGTIAHGNHFYRPAQSFAQYFHWHISAIIRIVMYNMQWKRTSEEVPFHSEKLAYQNRCAVISLICWIASSGVMERSWISSVVTSLTLVLNSVRSRKKGVSSQ